MRTIRIKYHTDKIDKLKNIGEKKSDWIDLRAAESIKLEKGDFAIISLGVSMMIPTGYEAHIVPRSSTFKNWGIIQTNGIGIIDNSYSGDSDVWMMPVYATRDTEIKINDRICQFRLMKNQDNVNFQEVEFPKGKSRGGLGSTGTN